MNKIDKKKTKKERKKERKKGICNEFGVRSNSF